MSQNKAKREHSAEEPKHGFAMHGAVKIKKSAQTAFKSVLNLLASNEPKKHLKTILNPLKLFKNNGCAL